MKEIISCSRRTDIPAFYYDWLQESLQKEEVECINPFGPNKYNVSLKPSDVHSIVLWSKNFANVVKNPALLNKYNLFFHFTITGYSKKFESLSPPMETTIEQMKQLASKYSPEQINWRFDPIMFTQDAEQIPKGRNSSENRLETFRYLCQKISEYGVTRCTISYLDLYGKVQEVFKKKKIDLIMPNDQEMIQFTDEIVKIANEYGIQIYTCAEKIAEGCKGVFAGKCIDGELLANLFGERASKAQANLREGCGCTKSKDIGNYLQKCKHGCLYCYANPATD